MSEDISTRLIHHDYRAPDGWDAVPVGVHKGSTVFFKNCADLNTAHPRDGTNYRYGLHGTPTSYTLAARLATLEGAEHCLLTPSGLSAITLVNLALLGPGDEILLPDNVYGQNRYCADDLLPRFGITRRYYDPLDVAGLEIRSNTRLVWVEAAGSITLEFPDMLSLVRRCREAGVICALDNTWGAGIAFKPFDLDVQSEPGLGFDVSMQALTKYPSGGADVLAGAVYTKERTLHERLNVCHEHLGYHLAANDVELLLRGLPTLALRYRAQDATTRSLARWMQGRSEIAQVLHPALDGSPGHAFWAAQSAQGAACLFSAVFRPEISTAQVHRYVDALKRFRIGYSWAGPLSLVVPYDLRRSRNFPRRFAPGTVVRFAIGLEDAADLRADLEQAFEVLG